MRKVLIANRGEIAVRIARTLREMGIASVAVYSEADAGAPHVAAMDEAYALDGNTLATTYLDIPKLLAIAKQAGTDAVHPGYGFLSENAPFADACARVGLTFIGPKPEVIAAMGDKIIAKKAMADAGVPVVPGWTGDSEDIAAITAEATQIGYPVLVKAAAGGGGKGMRRVDDPADLADAVAAAAREALKAFGDARVFLEKYILQPRHVEFQIFGDTHGNVVHLFERDCSIQRRHQKVIEESPAPHLPEDVRERMGQAAVLAAKAIGYTNAGTVEFIVDATGNFYFLEVNTRLQVEHPVTECVTHHDLVRLQVQIARGEALPFTQADLRQDGHALECRIYAEDPANNFLPAIGPLSVYRPPSGPGVRVDSGVVEGGEVTVHYDPMLAKLIVWAEDRDAAVSRMSRALADFPVLGVATNIGFLQRILAEPDFADGAVHTHFLETHAHLMTAAVPDADNALALALAGLIAAKPGQHRGTGNSNEPPQGGQSPWLAGTGWRIGR